VQAGNIITAALITGIRSDLPGQITAMNAAEGAEAVALRVRQVAERLLAA